MQGLLFAIRSGFESRFPLQRELRGQIKIWPLFRLYLLFFSDFSLSSPPNQSGLCPALKIGSRFSGAVVLPCPPLSHRPEHRNFRVQEL